MITATISESAPRLTRPRSPLGPLCLWSVIQIAVLCLSAGQVPLAPTKGFPDPPELFATPFMIGVQIGIAALLFPYLMRELAHLRARYRCELALHCNGTSPRRPTQS